MKRLVKKSEWRILCSFAILLGGVFLASSASAQVANTPVVTNAPTTKQYGATYWKSPDAALVTVQSEIALLTAKYQQMKQAGAEPALLHKVKLELHLYLTIQKALEYGFSTLEAFEMAWEASGLGLGEDATSTTVMSPAEAQAIYDKAIGKLSD